MLENTRKIKELLTNNTTVQKNKIFKKQFKTTKLKNKAFRYCKKI